MNGQNEENLKELFEQFVGAEQAEKAAEDIQKAEQILREYPAPEPDDMLIADIKAEIALGLLSRKTGVLRRTAYKAVIAAAAVMILVSVGIKLFEKDSGKPELVKYVAIIPRAVWESDDIATDDADLAIFTAKIEQIEDEALALQLGENGSNGDRAVTELEAELVEIDSDFWKG